MQNGNANRGGVSIIDEGDITGVRDSGVLTLLFAHGRRPGIENLESRSRVGAFSVSHRNADRGLAELLINGLTFHCEGLSGGSGAGIPSTETELGEPDPSWRSGEAIAISAGPHIASGAGLPPVVRSQMDLALALCELEGLVAVHWSPSQCCLEPFLFTRLITRWLDGGAFPAPGLVAIHAAGEDLETRGLAFLHGRELRIGPLADLTRDDRGRLAIRLINELAEAAPLTKPYEFVDQAGRRYLLRPNEDGDRVSVEHLDGSGS